MSGNDLISQSFNFEDWAVPGFSEARHFNAYLYSVRNKLIGKRIDKILTMGCIFNSDDPLDSKGRFCLNLDEPVVVTGTDLQFEVWFRNSSHFSVRRAVFGGKPEWEILPKRWIVERTLSWLSHSRRLSKDYEITTDSEENFIYIAHMAILLRRLF